MFNTVLVHRFGKQLLRRFGTSHLKLVENKPNDKGSLKEKLVQLIRLNGQLTVDKYMKIVLTNPESGFYMSQDVFGVKGHFTTNPEISQIFGEILGAWILQEWQRFNRPKPLKLIEFGPGRGTLMSDIARTLNKFENQLEIQLIEISPKMRELQKQTLERWADKTAWFSHISELESQDQNGFSAFIAHEYLDALPIYKFVKDKTTNSWRELLIDYDQNEELRFCISRQPSLSARLLVPENFQGDHLEVCPEAAMQLEKASNIINSSQKGCMLICDYGFDGQEMANRDTFRAFKNHEPWFPLKDPGEADLTADVDFGYIKNHLKDKALVFGSVDQANFLLKCGLQQRLQTLLERAKSESDKGELMSSFDMMVNEMGSRYRFLSIFPKGSESLFKNDPPAGFNT